MTKAYSVRHYFQNAAEAVGNGAALDVAGLSRLGLQVAYATAASASASPSGSASISPSGSASPSSSASISPSASASRSPSASASPSGSASPSSSPSAAPTGTSGTVYFEATVNGVDWLPLPVTPIAGGTAVTVATAPGIWIVSVAGFGLVRARLGGTVLGAVTVTGVATSAGT